MGAFLFNIAPSASLSFAVQTMKEMLPLHFTMAEISPSTAMIAWGKIAPEAGCWVDGILRYVYRLLPGFDSRKRNVRAFISAIFQNM